MAKKVAVITGAGTGLGAALVKRYADLGYHVCLIGRRQSVLQEVVNKYELTGQSTIYSLDVSKRSQVSEVFTAILSEHRQIDVLVNNAGVGYFDKAERITDEQIDQMIDINLKGTIYCAQEVIPSMRERDLGTILNVISTAGLEGKDTEAVNEAKVKSAGIPGVQKIDKTNYQVIVGTDVQFVADELIKLNDQ